MPGTRWRSFTKSSTIAVSSRAPANDLAIGRAWSNDREILRSELAAGRVRPIGGPDCIVCAAQNDTEQ